MNETDEPGGAPEPMMMCPVCHGEGHVHVPTLAILDGQPQTVLAPRECRQCRESAMPGWLPGFTPPS